jgi:hypothetical protein
MVEVLFIFTDIVKTAPPIGATYLLELVFIHLGYFRPVMMINTKLIKRAYSLFVMASSSSSFNVYIPGDTIPTAQTKIKLADRILVSPLGE